MLWAAWLLGAAVAGAARAAPAACDRSRAQLRGQRGHFSAGPPGANYTHDSHCQWLIESDLEDGWITVMFTKLSTECSFDYIFVFDGPSPEAPLLASFSGQSQPQNVTGHAKQMLVVLYSDTNYVLEGFEAEYIVAACPADCSGRGVCADGGQCVCHEGYEGPECAWPLAASSMGQWKWLARGGLLPRAGHSAAYVAAADRLIVFGGHDLNSVLDHLQAFDFKMSTWMTLSSLEPGPSARFGHAAANHPLGFVLHGGQLADGRLSDDLWLYESANRRWVQHGLDCNQRPPPLARHTLTLGHHDALYLFGGQTDDGHFSNQLWRLRIGRTPQQDECHLIEARAGKQLDLRLAGHTTVFHAASQSLIVYGGLAASHARAAALSDRMFAFHVDSNVWAELGYPRGGAHVPLERAFHSATVVGEVLVVVGGYSQRHHRHETCHDAAVFLYHLQCHTWLETPGVASLPSGGRFAHAAVLRGGQLLLTGGYDGRVAGDLLSWTPPPSAVGGRSACGHLRGLAECAANPECGFCSADDTCHPRTGGANCTTNLQTTRCLGICPALSDCHSCLAVGNVSRGDSVAVDLRLGQCSWCVQTARCHPRDDKWGICGVGEDTPSQSPGWWGFKGTEVSHLDTCTLLDKRPGLTFLKYAHPANFSQPDFVSVINATSVEVSAAPGPEGVGGGETVARLRGFLRVPPAWRDEALCLCVAHAAALLRVSSAPGQPPAVVANASASDARRCGRTAWPTGEPAILSPGRLNIDLEARRPLGAPARSSPANAAAVQLAHGLKCGPTHRARVFTFESLEAWEGGGDCSGHSNCLQCVSDQSCGWCELSGRCESRSLEETASCSRADGHWRFLTLRPAACPNCSDLTECAACAQHPLCEWWPHEALCTRRGRWKGAVVDASTCPAQCHLRKSCDSCLSDAGPCVWCHSRQECFVFSAYTSQMQFGQCREWQDKGPCRSCSALTNCSSCLRTLGCGWCHSTESPINGACAPGDWTQPQSGSCPATTAPATDTAWAFGECPDVDECALGLHECHPAATCRNTPGAYECECPRGFIGDGRRECRRTCPVECINGHCGGAPHYECVCRLGWTGSSCNESCGCNGHASCSRGPGQCDECVHLTSGPTCGECQQGAFGDPTSHDGCSPCQCNGHGEVDRGLCQPDTGHCFCTDHTEGPTCATCRKGFYGDPREGGACYRGCAPRALLSGLTAGSLGAADARPLDECLWVIWPHANISQPPAVLIHLQLNELNIECGRNGVYLYDGLPSGGHLLAVACINDSNLPLSVEAKTGLLSVYFHPGETGESFNASYEVLQCPDQCPGERRACVDGACVCAEGWTGLGCLVAICPGNCSSRGLCDRNSGGCVCPRGWGGAACETALNNNLAFSTLFRAGALPDSLDHLRRTLPRFGHSVAADRRGGLWLFGGLSLSLGPLNDVRLFDTRNATWMQVTVDSTREAALPAGRYFHAAALVAARRELYVHGGIGSARGPAEGPFGCRSTALRDLWVFSLKAHRWEQVAPRGPQPAALAGHSLVLRHGRGRPPALLLLGGLEPCKGPLDLVWQFDLDTRLWNKLDISGFWPPGVFGHSAVYHPTTDAIYIFGGYEGPRSEPSDKLYAFHVASRTWTLLPPFIEYNPPELLVPRARALHSSVSTEDYLLVFGGRTHPYNSTDLLLAYSYSCNLWVQLLPSDVEVVGAAPPSSVGQAMARDPDSGTSFVVGGLAGSVLGRVTGVRAPAHLCALFAKHKDACRGVKGCSFCAMRWRDGSQDARCFPAGSAEETCDAINATVSVNNGQPCDAAWLARRECGASRACSECLATWPSQAAPPCRWCGERCVSAEDGCGHSSLSTCRPACAGAADCASCAERGCAWRDGMCVESEGGAWGGRCPAPCAAHATCRACLSAPECAWATRTASCLAIAHAPLLCVGGTCGLVLKGGGADHCPRACSALTQCSTCLRHARCGWCWTQLANATGQGFCADGSMDGADSRVSCADSTRIWHYAECPPEDECANGHHDCDPRSERCVNLLHGYKCECNQGYEPDKSTGGCVPVCPKGCIHGRCVEPNKCECDFGYVGSDCSLQCKCNGHSHCEGPDALDKCLKCLNNTEGSQCERCRVHFVGNPVNNGRCIACSDYCHGHSAACVEAGDSGSGGSSGNGAVCVRCSNHTSGERCHECVRGHFRASEVPRDACRPCECHSHGDACDPNTGAHCNCRNNTESDAQCAAGARTGANGLPCWRLQCSRCKEYFTGTPTGGHACYRQMTVELEYCAGEACAALESGRVAFFAVQPRFMNVDIRLVVDVGGAGADVWLAPRDDALVVGTDGRVTLDPRLGNATLRDLPAHGLSTFATLGAAHALVVRALRHRLVVTLPQSAHDLAVARFYVAVQARDAPLHGQLHFRQDQLHIDLFVFFSVFFSCFFLALAAGLLLWKAKQAADLRRARRRHVVEMLHLARRPFASAAVALGVAPGRPRHRHRRPKEPDGAFTLENLHRHNSSAQVHKVRFTKSL